MKKATENTPSHTGHRQRVFDKIKASGFGSFYDYELLEFVLFAAEGRKDTKQQAKTLLNHFGSIKGVMEATRDEIKHLGFNDRYASVIESYREMLSRYMVETNKPPENLLDTTFKAKEYMKALTMGKKVEFAYCAYLDPAKRIIETEKISEGTPTHTAIHTENIVRKALFNGAKYIVLGHNHVSGKLRASSNDLIIFDELVKELNTIRVFVFDFIISCDNEAISMREKDVLKDNMIIFANAKD